MFLLIYKYFTKTVFTLNIVFLHSIIVVELYCRPFLCPSVFLADNIFVWLLWLCFCSYLSIALLLWKVCPCIFYPLLTFMLFSHCCTECYHRKKYKKLLMFTWLSSCQDDLKLETFWSYFSCEISVLNFLLKN